MPSRASGQTLKRVFQQVLLTTLGAALVALIPWSFGVWDRWEAKTWDMRAAWLASAGAATPEIVLILLDQQSLDWAQEQNGLSWPWPREVYGAVADFCRRAGAKSLTMDVLFLEPSVYGLEDDAVFADALEGFGNTALAVFLSRTRSGGQEQWPQGSPQSMFAVDGNGTWLTPFRSLNLVAHRVSPPVPELARASRVLGNVQLHPDADGVYRRMSPFALFHGNLVPSLGLASYLSASSPKELKITSSAFTLDTLRVPLDAAGNTLLRYRGPSGTHASVNAAAVLQSELRLREGQPSTVDPDLMKDKYVFFGFTAPGLFDLRPTPMSGAYPGVEIQATFLDNLLSQDLMREIPAWSALLLFLGFTLTTAWGLTLFRAPLTGAALGGLMLILPIPLAGIAYQQGWWVPVVLPEAGILAVAILGLLFNYSSEGRQKKFIKNAFRQYLSPQVIEQLIRHPEQLKLGGQRKVLSIFFSDLQGFTSISERLDPEELTAMLNDYLSAMTEIIHQQQGTVDKYEGDAIIAFWNAPLEVPDHALRAVRAALLCQARLDEMRPEFRKRTGHDLYMRIGINTGAAVVGNMGSHQRFDYSMLGDAVNLAARLEGVNKQFGTWTMVSSSTREAAGPAISMRELGRVAVVGRKEAVVVFEPLPDQLSADRKEHLKRFAEGLQAYYAGDFARALELFEGLSGDDPAAAKYVIRCRILIASPPVGWNGIWIMDSK
jgi:adenylate cyclase